MQSARASHTLGDLVDLWGTINEVKIVSDHGFLDGGELPPGLNDFGAFMMAMRHLSMAHGLAYEQVKRGGHGFGGGHSDPLV